MIISKQTHLRQLLQSLDHQKHLFRNDISFAAKQSLQTTSILGSNADIITPMPTTLALSLILIEKTTFANPFIGESRNKERKSQLVRTYTFTKQF